MLGSLDRGANTDAQDAAGNLALDVAALGGKHSCHGNVDHQRSRQRSRELWRRNVYKLCLSKEPLGRGRCDYRDTGEKVLGKVVVQLVGSIVV